MTAHFRRLAVPTLLVLFIGLAVSAGHARQAQRTQTPDMQALTAANAISDPAARLAAYEKIRTDFPDSTNLAGVDSQMLSTLVGNFPDRMPAITAVFDRIIARIPADAAPDARLSATTAPVNVLVARKLLLDRAEPLLTSAIAALDFEKYAQTQRDNAKRANRAEPTPAQIETSFGRVKAGGLETLAKVYVAKGFMTGAEGALRECVKVNPAFGAATTSLVDLYTAKNDYASAEAVLKDSIKAATTPVVASRPQVALADVYIKKGDDKSAEALLKDVVSANPTLATALLPLARLETKRGDNAAALDHFMTAALGGSLKAADDASLKSLWAKAHNGSEAGLDEALDKAYREKFPNPVDARSVQADTEAHEQGRPARDVHGIGLPALRVGRPGARRRHGSVRREHHLARVSPEHPAAGPDGGGQQQRPPAVLLGLRRADAGD